MRLLLIALAGATACGVPQNPEAEDADVAAAALRGTEESDRAATERRAYRLGGIGAFAEMVAGGVKTLALSAAVLPEEMDALVDDATRIAAENGAEMYRERDFLVTDLFPASVTEGREVLVIYTGDTLDRYLALKEEKAALVDSGEYDDPAIRAEIARKMGELLSYPDWKVDELLGQN